eukprot:jgi/Botrbrau1/11950/Bobra.341_1s0015.1
MGTTAFLAYAWYEEKQNKKRLQNVATISDTLDGRKLKEIVGEENVPSWVRFPDHERVGWANDLLTQFWPHVTAAAGKMVREEAEPKLKEAKPSWMSDLRLAAFTLGAVPPRLNSIKVYRREALMGEVIMELDFMWAGQQKFQLLIKPFPKLPLPLNVGKVIANLLSLSVGVQDIYVAGRVRLSCKPLLGRIPIVGAVKLDGSRTVQGGDISFVPGLEVFINGFVNDYVLQPFVLPEGVTVPLDPQATRANVRNPFTFMPQGILYVKLIEAENVPRMDLLTGCDPYVLLFCAGRKKRKSQVHYHTRQPRQMVAVLKDHNTWGNDEEIGRLTLPIKDLPSGQAQDLWLELGPSKGTSLTKLSRNPLKAGGPAVSSGTIRNRNMGGGTGAADRLSISLIEGSCPLSWEPVDWNPAASHFNITYYRAFPAPHHITTSRFGADDLRLGMEASNNMDGSDSVKFGDPQEGRAEIQAAAPESTEGRALMNMLRGGVLTVEVRKGDDSGLEAQAQPNSSGNEAYRARQACPFAIIVYLVRMFGVSMHEGTPFPDHVHEGTGCTPFLRLWGPGPGPQSDPPGRSGVWSRTKGGSGARHSEAKSCVQVFVTVGGQSKSTAEARGKENPDWAETLEFAVSGDIADSPDEEIQTVAWEMQCEVWDFHWVNADYTCTWGSRLGKWESFPQEMHIGIPLRDVVRQRMVSRVWDMPGTGKGSLDLQLSWYPILESS